MPAVVTNGEVFTATLSYAVPTPPGNRFERFEFKWASRCADFTEKTELEKAWTPGSGGVIGSFESIVVPAATCIEGTFEAQVKVKGSVNCKANAYMTVVNP